MSDVFDQSEHLNGTRKQIPNRPLDNETADSNEDTDVDDSSNEDADFPGLGVNEQAIVKMEIDHVDTDDGTCSTTGVSEEGIKMVPKLVMKRSSVGGEYEIEKGTEDRMVNIELKKEVMSDEEEVSVDKSMESERVAYDGNEKKTDFVKSDICQVKGEEVKSVIELKEVRMTELEEGKKAEYVADGEGADMNKKSEAPAGVDDVVMSSTDTSDEDYWSSGDEFEPGNYTSYAVMKKWENQGYIPLPINKQSNFGEAKGIPVLNGELTRKTFGLENNDMNERRISASNENGKISEKIGGFDLPGENQVENDNMGSSPQPQPPSGSRRNKAFKMKLTFKRDKASNEYDPEFDKNWSADDTESDKEGGDYLNQLSQKFMNSVDGNSFMSSMGLMEGAGENLPKTLIEGNQMFIAKDKMFLQYSNLFGENSGNTPRKKMASGENFPEINEQEVAQSAFKYFQNITSAMSMNMLQEQGQMAAQRIGEKNMKNMQGRKRTRWVEKNIKIIDGKKWRECFKCAKLFRTRKDMRDHNKEHKNDPISEPDLKIIDGKRWRECSYCKKLFHTRKELRIHFRIHTNEKPYECDVCGKGFKQLAHMNSHMKIHSGEKPHTCEMCGMNFSERSSLKRHIRRHLGIKPFKCTVCGNDYYTSTLLKAHMGSHMIKSGEMERYECHICGRSYTRRETLNVHMKTHDPDKQIKCEKCDAVFLTHSHLRRHLLTHQENLEKNFLCGECNKCFITKELLSAHMLTHKTENVHKCELCGKMFKHKYTLKSHMVQHDPDKEEKRVHECKICGSSFFTRSNLGEHMKTHSDVRPFECNICSKTFKRNAEYVNHVKNHDEKPHKCKHCPKTYAFRKGLKQHVEKHHPEEAEQMNEQIKQEEVFPCEKCGKSFRLKSSLKCHMKIHTDQALECDICGKRFYRPSQLEHHKISHGTERKQQCHLCPKNFKFSTNLKRHLTEVHKKIVISNRQNYQCPHCETLLNGKADILSHMESFHGISVKDILNDYIFPNSGKSLSEHDEEGSDMELEDDDNRAENNQTMPKVESDDISIVGMTKVEPQDKSEMQHMYIKDDGVHVTTRHENISDMEDTDIEEDHVILKESDIRQRRGNYI